MLQLHKVGKSFSGKVILNDVTLTFISKQLHAIIGANGAGKSTLLNLISGNINPNSGAIMFNDSRIESERDWVSFKSIMGFCGQNDFLIEELTPIEYLQLVGLIYKISRAEIAERTELLFRYFDLDENKVKHTISTLSFGTRKKISFCALFLNNPKIIILDEPFASVDKLSSRKLVELLKKSLSNGSTILLATHTFDYIAEFVDNVIVVENQTCKSVDRNTDKAVLEKYVQLDHSVENEIEINELGWIK